MGRTTKFIGIDRNKECPKQTIKNHWASPVLKGPKADHQRHWDCFCAIGLQADHQSWGKVSPSDLLNPSWWGKVPPHPLPKGRAATLGPEPMTVGSAQSAC